MLKKSNIIITYKFEFYTNLSLNLQEMDVIYGKLLIFDSSTQEVAEQTPSVRLKESFKNIK